MSESQNGLPTRIRQNPWRALTALIGNQDNKAVTHALLGILHAMSKCAEEFRNGKDMNLEKVIELERRGDAALAALEEVLEPAFVLRGTLQKADVTSLGHELDNVLDGMRAVSRHIVTYERFLPELPTSSRLLFVTVDECVNTLCDLVPELTHARIDFPRVNQYVNHIKDLERHADELRDKALYDLVNGTTVDYFTFKAKSNLDNLLESITDHAKRCAVIVLSMARREA